MNEKELNPKQRKFAELLVQGHTTKAAYLAAFPNCRLETSAIGKGSWLKQDPRVKAVMKELRDALAEEVKEETVVMLKEALEFLTEVIRTPPGEVTEGHRICQSFKRTPTIWEVKLPNKLRALELAMKLQGFLTDNVRHEAGDTLQDFLVELRAGGFNPVE